MIFGKLKTEVPFLHQKSPNEILECISDCITVKVIDYQLNENNKFFVDFCKLKEIPKFPASTLPEEQELIFTTEKVKRFFIELTNKELDTWGANDEDLLHIIAAKYKLEIESFLYL